MIQVPNVTPVSDGAVWADKLNKYVKTNTVTPSKDYRSHSTAQGTSLRPNTNANTNAFSLTLPTLYDKDECYGPGNLVFVKEALFVNQVVNGIRVQRLVPAGMWLCVQLVPSNKFAAKYAQYGPQYVRKAGVNVYPTWPLSSNEDNIYWFPFVSFLTMKACINGVSTPYLVAGSTFTTSSAA